MGNKLLSIAIPTWNGAKTIKIVLEKIIPQLVDGVELVISDNASTDAAPGIIKELQLLCPALKYYRNDKNVGFDKNVDLCVRRSLGEYVWLFADDDIMREDAINEVLKIISRDQQFCEIYVDSLKPFTVLTNDQICQSGDEFLNITKLRAGGMSANVINKEIWEKTDFTMYYGSGFIHYAYLIENLNKCPSYIYRESLKYELDDSYKREDTTYYFRSMLRLVKIFKNMAKNGFEAETQNKAINMIKDSYLINIPLAYKPNGLRVDWPLIRECISVYKWYPSFWFVDLPLLLVPAGVYKFMIYLVRKIRGKIK